ncbi:MAG: hypothetical protein KGI73_04815 [Patescibacteria group bacterium]|nr:hypothetical protein [Patescibacteria group bacterium]
MNTEQRICQNCKQQFVIEPDDFAFYEKIKVPPPTWCPMCRAWRRMAFRDYRALHKRKDDWNGKEIFSIFSNTSPFKVYNRDAWWSDAWDPRDYGRDYDFSKTFFAQMRELMRAVPMPAQTAWNMANSAYCTGAHDLKNCYLVFVATNCEDCMYCAEINQTKSSLDLLRAESTESSYHSFGLTKCYRTFFSSHCEDCVDVWFSRDCQGCNNCFGCANLRNKSYHIFNQPHSNSEYEKKLKEFRTSSHQSLAEARARAEEFWKSQVVRSSHGRHNANASGEYVSNSKNVRGSYFVNGGEDCRYAQYLFIPTSKDCMDVTQYGDTIELVYEVSSCGAQSSGIKFSYRVSTGSSDCEYCTQCISVSHCFGCAGLQKKEYCILNKQYTKEEYEILVPKIKDHMNKMPFIDKKGRTYAYGEFFPPELAPFTYNETMAKDFFPLAKEEALAEGYMWKDFEGRSYAVTLTAAQLPDDITDVPDSIAKEVIGCAHGGLASSKCSHECTEAFRITPQEVQFYRRMNLPLPRLCHNCRHYDRVRLQSPMKLWNRKCQCAGMVSENSTYKNLSRHRHAAEHCPNEFDTSYAPDRPEIVYCEDCYNAEIA